MAQWSTKRKTSYAALFILAVVVVIVAPAVYFFYTAPTCSDGTMNQDETGVDCGGSCPRICSTAYVPPTIGWARADQIGTGLYNLAAYVKNANPTGGVRRAPYKFSMYDRDGHFIGERAGVMMLPPHKNVIAFESAVATNQSIPYRVTFEFTKDLAWEKAIPNDDALIIVDRSFTSDETGYFLKAALQNNGRTAVTNVVVEAILYDPSGTVVGFSRTVVDSVARNGKEDIAFTWRQFGTRNVASSEIIPIVTPTYAQ